MDSIERSRVRKKVKKITKSKCKYYDVGNCMKFGKRCFDCKEYNKVSYKNYR